MVKFLNYTNLQNYTREKEFLSFITHKLQVLQIKAFLYSYDNKIALFLFLIRTSWTFNVYLGHDKNIFLLLSKSNFRICLLFERTENVT